MLLLSSMLFVFNSPVYVLCIAIAVEIFAAIGGSLPNIFRFKYFFILIFVVSVIVWQFYFRGTGTRVSLGLLDVSRQGLLYGTAVGIRFVGVLTVGVFFVSCTRTEDLAVGLTRLRLPRTLALVVAMAIRLVPTFVSATSTIMEAQMARGLDVRTKNPVKRVRYGVPVAVPLMMYALRHASLMSLALEARGFSPQSPRTSYADPAMRPRDVVVLVMLALCFGGCLWWRLSGHGAVIPGRI
jgi:energy-coupling factor transport system permease protein